MVQTNFLYKCYNDFKFKYMQSIGIKDIMQNFAHPEYGSIGFLHCKWKKIEGKDTWQPLWYNTQEEAEQVANLLYTEKIYDEIKILQKIYKVNIPNIAFEQPTLN